MTDKPVTERPRKLSLGRRIETSTKTREVWANASEAVISRSKRIIRRESVPAKPKPKPAPKPQARKRKPDPKKPLISPSELRLRELDAALSGKTVWMDRKPLALGIEREVFQFINRNELSASKRVVQKLLHRHTHREQYLQNVGAGGARYHLDGSEAGRVLALEREHAGRVLAGMAG
ncbi:MAG TPA: ProQ/FINO family protein [Thiolinea sp.]|nr:ProQ/FINO family protein [Thiolinea sp.]